jgi:hypothetical protein
LPFLFEKNNEDFTSNKNSLERLFSVIGMGDYGTSGRVWQDPNTLGLAITHKSGTDAGGKQA